MDPSWVELAPRRIARRVWDGREGNNDWEAGWLAATIGLREILIGGLFQSVLQCTVFAVYDRQVAYIGINMRFADVWILKSRLIMSCQKPKASRPIGGINILL